ncbi:Maff2 family mobile element protein [Enterococcus faecium]|uniref:Maff2 family mobile element protein n=1 Tax=Enterococcus faecium TaxID=1352 RepID=UPI00316D535D
MGGGLGLWGIVNLIEGYGNDNPGAKSQGMKQFMSGAGLVLVGQLLVPVLGNLL